MHKVGTLPSLSLQLATATCDLRPASVLCANAHGRSLWTRRSFRASWSRFPATVSSRSGPLHLTDCPFPRCTLRPANRNPTHAVLWRSGATSAFAPTLAQSWQAYFEGASFTPGPGVASVRSVELTGTGGSADVAKNLAIFNLIRSYQVCPGLAAPTPSSRPERARALAASRWVSRLWRASAVSH